MWFIVLVLAEAVLAFNCGQTSPTTVSPGSGANSTVPEFVSGAYDFTLDGRGGIRVSSGDTFEMRLGQPSIAGNAILAGFTTGITSNDYTVTDDGNNSYSCVEGNDNGNSQNAVICYALNASPAQTITITAGSSAPQMWGFWVQTFRNVNALDASNGGGGSGSSISAGSITPSQSGDLFVTYVYNDSYDLDGSNPVTWTAGSQSDISWQLSAADRLGHGAVEWGVYDSTAPLNPAMRQSVSSNYVAVAVAFKAASAGGPQTGPYIASIHHLWLTFSGFDTSGRVEQNPCPSSANLLYLASIGADPDNLTGVSDSQSNAWGPTGASVANSSLTQSFYSANAAVSPSMTFTLTGSYADASALMYCAGGASTWAFDGTRTNTGNTGTAGSTFGPTVSIVPSTASGIVFAQVGVDWNTINGVTGSGQYVHTDWWSAENESLEGLDQNNGWASQVYTSTSPISWTWHVVNSSLAVGDWASRADSFTAK